MLNARLNIAIAVTGFIAIGFFLYFLGKAIYHFLLMVKNVSDPKFYYLGPVILLSDMFFIDDGIKHKREFIKNSKYLLLIGVLLFGVGLFISYFNE